MSENQIVVNKPNETGPLDTHFENETMWLTQHQMAFLFGCCNSIVSHLNNVYASHGATTEDYPDVLIEEKKQALRNVIYFNLETIISIERSWECKTV